MQEGDKIKVALVTEMAGVASSNLFYFDVSDANLVTTIEAALLEIATSFNTALGTIRSSAAILTCATWENLDGNDPFTQAFFNLAGGGAANSLPSQGCVRITRYGIDSGSLKVGGICVTGIVESSVVRGRLVDAGEMGTMEGWLVAPLILAAGPTLDHGFFFDTGPAPLVDTFVFTTKARTRPQIRSLSKRRSRLCGA